MTTDTDLRSIIDAFQTEVSPLESAAELKVLTDNRTDARYCECHIEAGKIIPLATTDVPLDVDEPDYRANRELVTNAPAFTRMKEDALLRRSFSNIVAEYTKEFDAEHPLKIIGGQHRIEAIKESYAAGVNEFHGLKVYVALSIEQRLDVQLISNTNIAISRDLFDRMQETFKGPELRNWCQAVGLLAPGQDFADRRIRGGAVSVQLARTFTSNYFAGARIDMRNFDTTKTQPELSASGQNDPGWETLRSEVSDMWETQPLKEAATEFARLITAQRNSFPPRSRPVDYPEKAVNLAIVASWAFVAGMLQKNEQKLKRHFALADMMGRDPLNASVLAKGRHKSDPPQYRGLGYRTDPQECGRLVELFYLLADRGVNITGSSVELAIGKFYAKQAHLDMKRLEAKL
jgi:hypothetical protein